VLIALHENGTSFERRVVDLMERVEAAGFVGTSLWNLPRKWLRARAGSGLAFGCRLQSNSIQF
jgi:hypothetical protein